VVKSDDFALHYTQYCPNFTSLIIVLNHIWNHLGYQWSRGLHYSVLCFI